MRRFLALGSFMAQNHRKFWTYIQQRQWNIELCWANEGKPRRYTSKTIRTQWVVLYRIFPSHPWVYFSDPQKNFSIWEVFVDPWGILFWSVQPLALSEQISSKPLKVSSRWLQARSTRQQFQQFLLEADLVPGGRPLVSTHPRQVRHVQVSSQPQPLGHTTWPNLV